jgi:hypothetical protein
MFATSAFAQQETFMVNRSMKCGDAQRLMNDMFEQYGEKLVWSAKSEHNESYFGILKNVETGTWTLIQFDSKIGCVVGSGSQGRQV